MAEPKLITIACPCGARLAFCGFTTDTRWPNRWRVLGWREVGGKWWCKECAKLSVAHTPEISYNGGCLGE